MEQKKIAAATLLFLLTGTALAGQPERYYADNWCAGRGQREARMPDKTRCDCLTATHAIEFDFGPKWAEAIGQSLNYALQTNKRAGIVLILRDKKDYKYWVRLNSVIQHHKLPIDTWMAQGESPPL